MADVDEEERRPVTRPIVTIGLLDNDEFALAFLSRAIKELMPEASVRFRTRSGREAVDRCLDSRTAPDVLLTDMSMEELSGLSVTRAIRTRSARVAVLAVTSFSLAVYAAKAAEAGAQGIVPKSVEAPIIEAIRALALGGIWNASMPSVVFETSRAAHERLRREPMPRQFLLSDREAEAMNLCSRGLPTVAVAAQMGVGLPTAKTYIARAVRKLGCSSRGSAIALWTGAGEGER